MANQNLSAAKKAKNDEFYTQFTDVEKEMNAYLEYDEDLFRGKTVLLPCDDPEWSNFTKYFAQNFERLGIKKLISTSYAPASKGMGGGQQPTLFESESPQYDPAKALIRGRLLVLDQDTTKDGKIDHKDLRWDYLEGDGDFRSEEVTKLRDQADIVITNPPFSLFREYIGWLLKSKVKFAIIGNVNASTFKEVFPLIKSNKIWWGASPRNMSFTLPDKKQKDVNAVWYTNIDHGRRHQPLSLMTMSDNLKFSKHSNLKNNGYQKYDNYDAIEVPFTDAIPSDYPGVMGVPITFFSKYNPDQFQLLGITQRNDDPFKTKKYTTDEYPNANDLNARGVIIVDGTPKSMYARVLVRHKPEEENQ